MITSYMAKGALQKRVIVYNQAGFHDLLLGYNCILHSTLMLQCLRNHSITRCAELINQIVIWFKDKIGGIHSFDSSSPSCHSTIQCSRKQNILVSFAQKIHIVHEVVLHV